MKKLCVREGELVWNVYIDIYALNDDGNLIDAAAIAAVVALNDAKIPEIKEDKVQYGKLTNKKLPLGPIPITITCYKTGNHWILNPTSTEEEIAKVKLSIGMTFGKEVQIHAMQKSGLEPLTEEEIMEAVKIAQVEGKKILNKIK
jgi:exosome complex component RRP42